MPHKGTRSAKAPAKKASGAPKPMAKPRGQASALAEATEAASAAIQSSGASNTPSSTHSRPPAAASSEGETRPSPSQADPQAKAARTASDPDTGSGQRSLPVRNLTLSEGLARVRGAATQHQGAAAVQEEPSSSRKRSASQSLRRKARDSFRGLFDPSSDDVEEKGAPDTKGGLQPVWGYPWVKPEGVTGFPQAESVFWAWVLEQRYQRQELDQLKAELALSSVLDQRELRIEFAHLIAKRGLSVGGSARDDRGYGACAKVTIPSRVAKKPRTTYEATVASGPRSRQRSGSLPGAGPPAPTSSETWGIRATSQGAGSSDERAAPGEHAPHGSGDLRSCQEEPEEASYDYEPPTTAGCSQYPSRTVDPAVALQQEEMRLFRDRLYAIEIALGLGPGGQAAAQSGKQGDMEGLRAEAQSLSQQIRDLRDRVDRRAAVGEVSTLRQEILHL
ncbi:unnamed protein product [Phytophthora fragariaefolia]|uniref:Unnamed protein product n=1 Tax=Phytophthora fragariaefolia TaxID=1490495 RepID=A0A9W7CSH7_9STRA|nr:unnamed protein product [Phytophthora fragariaefolia]